MEEHTRKSSSDSSPGECNWKNGKEKRRTSILKPPKLRTPLKELQFTSNQEVKDDTTARQSRRVSFGHFHVRKFGYENDDVSDSIYSFESSKSEASSQAINSVGEYNKVPATNSNHHCKNMSPGTTDCKTDSHMKNTGQNASKHKYAETDNKSNVTDIGVCSVKMMLSKQIPDESTVFSPLDILAHRNSSDFLSYKSYGVRTDCKENHYIQKESFMGPNSIVACDMQLVHERDDIKQLHGLAKRGREQCEQKNEAEPRDCEHHLNSATVTDMVLADSYSFEHIECKEESLLGRKRKKSVDTTEKSFHFAAESDMELTKVVDNFSYGDLLNEGKDKSISLNKTRAKNNSIFSSDGHISKNTKDCNSMKNISQQFNATKRFSTNNAMDITEGCGLINSSSQSDISKSGMDDEINSHILSISRLSMDEEDGEGLEEKTSKGSRKYLNPTEFSEKSFINESMEQTVGVGCVLSGSDVDEKNATEDFQRNESVSGHLKYSDDNLLPISDEKGFSVTAATPLLNEDKLTGLVEKCRETKPDDTNNFNTSKTILMSVGMETTQNTCRTHQDNSLMQFTTVVEGKFQDSSMQESLVFLGNKYSPAEHFNIERQDESAIAKSTLKHDMDFTQVKSPLCDSGSVPEVVATDRQTDVGVTGTSSKDFLCKDKRKNCVSSYILDTKPNHPLILKRCGIDADESVFMLSEKANHESYCKERYYEGTISNSIKQTEHGGDKSVKCTTPCLTVDKNSKLCTVSSTLPEHKSEIIQQGQQIYDVGSSMCSVPSNSTPIPETENISNNRDTAGKILSKYSECQLYSSNRSEPHHLPTQTVEDYLVTDSETQCSMGSLTLSKKRRLSEKEETRDGPKCRKKQFIATDDINDKEQLQSTTAHSDLAVGTKRFYDRDNTAPLNVNSGVVNTAKSEGPALKIVDVPSDKNSIRPNTNMTLWKTDRPITNVSLPQPSDPNGKLNSSYTAKTIVYNRPSDFGLNFTCCETSSAAIETADCKNKLCGSTSVTDKRNTDSPLPENEILKRNIDEVINRSKTYGPKRYTTNSEEASSTTGSPANLSEVDVSHALLSEDKNPQPSDPNSKLNSSHAAKTIVFNRPTDMGLDFTCGTSSAAIETADCKNNLCGSTPVTDKRNTDSPLPGNEILKGNVDNVINRSKTYGPKRNTTNSEEASSTTGTPANIYEVNVPHTLLSKEKNPQPSDPNSKLNSSHAAKTIVFNRPTDLDLDFTCETSSAAIKTADCKNNLCGSTPVTDKRNTESPLPENEILKRNVDDVINRCKTYGPKSYTRKSEEASSTTGTPSNIYEVNVPHALLSEDKNPQPSDPNSKLNSSQAAKTIVFNRPTDMGLDFTCCETSSADIETADYKINLCGSTPVTDKRNTDSPIPENEILKRNVDDVINRSKIYGPKRYTRNSEEASSTTGMPANVSEVNVTHALLSEDKNPQPSDPNSKLNSSHAAKTRVFNRPTDMGLDFTCCETSSAVIQTADCKINLCGSTPVTDKSNTDSPLPENEILKRNIDDVINRSKTYGPKRYTRNSEEASSTTGMPANISEVNVQHALLIKEKNPQPSDPNSKQNSSHAAKTIVFNRPTDFDLDFTCCETRAAAIESTDCKNKLCASTSVSDKRNTDSQLPENEVMKRNIDNVINSSKTCGQKRYTRNPEEASSTAGTPAIISEINVPYKMLGKDKNSQHIEDPSVLQRNSAALTDDDKNKLFSATECNDQTTVTFRKQRRYKSYLASISFMQEDIKVRDYCTETDKNEQKAVVNAELSGDVGQTAVQSQSRYNESLTAVKEGGEQTEEEMEICNSSRNKCSFLVVAVHEAERTFHSWYFDKKASVVSDDSASSAGKINLSNSCQNPLGTYKSFPTQAPDVENNGVRLDHLPSKNEETGQNVTQYNNILDFKMSDGNSSTEIQVAQAKETISAVQIDNTSNYLIKNREQDSFSDSRVMRSCDRDCLKYYVQENGNSSFGKKMENLQFNCNDPVKTPDVCDEVLNVSSETNNLSKPTEKCHILSNLMEVSEPLELSEALEVNQLLQVHEPLEVNEPQKVKSPCEADPSYNNTKSQVTRKIVKDSHSVANTAQCCFPVALDTKLHTPSMDRDKDLPAVGLSVREYVTAVSPSSKSIRQSTARNCTSTAESAKIGMTINGVGAMGGSSVICGGQQNSKCDSSRSEVAVHSGASHTSLKKMNNIEGKKEITVATSQEEKPVENKCKKLENIIISQAERSGVLWKIRAMTQFQWIFTFLNETLRLYIDFDKPAEEGTIQDLNFISYLTGKADDDAKFVHFVLLKKLSKDKLKALSTNIEEVPGLLEKISVDVRRMLTFFFEFQKLQILYHMEMSGNSVSFNIRSYKLAISFKISIDLSNWEQILEDSITITQNLGKVNEAEVKNLANGVEKNSYFLRNYAKAVKQYMKILERFGC